MNKVLVFMIACVSLAILKVALIVLAIALPLALTYAFITRPGETLLFLGALTIFGLASARPTAFIIALGVVGVALVVAGAWPKARSQLPLTDTGAKARKQRLLTDSRRDRST